MQSCITVAFYAPMDGSYIFFRATCFLVVDFLVFGFPYLIFPVWR